MNFSFNKATIDVQWALISIGASSAAHFLLRIIFGRELGPEGLGIYTLAFTIYLFGMQFAAFGIGSALTKYVAEFIDNQEKIKIFVSSGMTSSIVTGTLMGVVIYLLSPLIANSVFHIPELESLIKLVAFCYPFIGVQKAVLGTLNGFRKMNYFAALNIVQNIIVVVVSLLFVIYFKMAIFGAVIGFVIPTIVISLISPLLISNLIQFDSSLCNYYALQSTMLFGFYVVLGNSISFLNTQVDSILLGYYLNPTDVGIYAIAILLAQILTIIPSAIQRVSGPITATLFHKGDIEGINEVIISIMKKTVIISVIIAIIIAIISPYLVNNFLSEDYNAFYIPLLVLLLGYAIYSPVISIGSVYGSIGKIKIPFRISALVGFVNIILNIAFIPVFGIIGAAAATTLSLIIGFILLTKLLKYYLQKDDILCFSLTCVIY